VSKLVSTLIGHSDDNLRRALSTIDTFVMQDSMVQVSCVAPGMYYMALRSPHLRCFNCPVLCRTRLSPLKYRTWWTDWRLCSALPHRWKWGKIHIYSSNRNWV